MLWSTIYTTLVVKLTHYSGFSSLVRLSFLKWYYKFNFPEGSAILGILYRKWHFRVSGIETLLCSGLQIRYTQIFLKSLWAKFPFFLIFVALFAGWVVWCHSQEMMIIRRWSKLPKPNGISMMNVSMICLMMRWNLLKDFSSRKQGTFVSNNRKLGLNLSSIISWLGWQSILPAVKASKKAWTIVIFVRSSWTGRWRVHRTRIPQHFEGFF